MDDDGALVPLASSRASRKDSRTVHCIKARAEETRLFSDDVLSGLLLFLLEIM